MKNPAILAGGLILVLSLLGFSIYELLADDTATEAGDVITQAQAAGEASPLPKPAPGRRVAFTSVTPREKLRQEKLAAAEAELAWVREVGEKVGDFYRVEVDGSEYYMLGELAKGFGRNGKPIYSTVRANKMAMGERRAYRGKQFPAHEVLHVDNAKDLPNFSMPKGAAKTMHGVGPQATKTDSEGAHTPSGAAAQDG